MEKVHVSISHFQNKKKHYLNEIINEFNKYKFQVDISIHTNKSTINNFNKEKYQNGKIKIIREFVFFRYLLFKNKNYYLTWTSRKRIKKSINNYDIFIYIEDDILIPVDTFDYWYKLKDDLYSNGYSQGFVRLETDKHGNEIAVDFYKKKLTNVINVQDKEFYVNDNNRYMACWIYDQKMMKKWIKSGYFDIKKIYTNKELRSETLDVLRIKNLHIRHLLYNFKNKKGFGIRENSAFGMHKESLPFFKEILIPKFETGIDKKAKIFHISNTYHDSGHDIIGVVNLNEIT